MRQFCRFGSSKLGVPSRPMIFGRWLPNESPSLKLFHLILNGFFSCSPDFEIYDGTMHDGEKASAR